MKLLDFVLENYLDIFQQVLKHITLTSISLSLAILVAVPLGLVATRKQTLGKVLLSVSSVFQTIPSIALLGALIPLLGIGAKPAIVSLFVYALLPILINTYTGVSGVDDTIIEAAKGMGLSDMHILTKIELPLAVPVMLAGVRTAAVINVGVATLAAYVGAGGLGEFIFGGIALNNDIMIIAGALFSAMLAILIDQFLALLLRLRKVQLRNTLVSFLAFFILLGTAGMAQSLLQDDKWKAGFNHEFAKRNDGYPRLQEVYGADFNTVLLSSALMYKALKQGSVDLIAGYSTDGRIKAYNLRPLTDDQHAFPPYFCAPLIRQELAERHPEVVTLLNRLAGTMNDSLMTALNYQVDFEKKRPKDVAKAFLEQKNLYRPPLKNQGETLRIGSKIFTESYILAHIFGQLIEGHTPLNVEVITGLGGTKVCFEALRNGEIALYPEYTGTGFMTLLNPDAKTRDALISDAEGVYAYTAQAFRKKYKLRWLKPLGFNNTYAILVRAATKQQGQLEKVSDL